jgi:hypothetical protein
MQIKLRTQEPEIELRGEAEVPVNKMLNDLGKNKLPACTPDRTADLFVVGAITYERNALPLSHTG